MEVVDFTVTDVSQRRIDDWTNSFWPFHLNENQSLEAEGRTHGRHRQSMDWSRRSRSDRHAVCRASKEPLGGPDEWLGEPVNWSRTWSSEVLRRLVFSFAFNPHTDDGLPSNTFFELRPSLSRRGPVDANAATSEDRTVVLTPTRSLLDTIQPQVNSLTALDAGRGGCGRTHLDVRQRRRSAFNSATPKAVQSTGGVDVA